MSNASIELPFSLFLTPLFNGEDTQRHFKILEIDTHAYIFCKAKANRVSNSKYNELTKQLRYKLSLYDITLRADGKAAYDMRWQSPLLFWE